jgi:hypothetical protein
MPNYGYDYGAGLAHGITHGSDELAKGIIAAHVQAKKQHADAEGVQGLLDIARRMQYPDQKTGKPTNFFKDEQLQYIQRLIDQKKYHAAGQAEAAMGIGKDMYTRIQSAAAKQAAAYQKAQEQQQIMQQGPVTVQDKTGRRYIYNPHTGAYQTDTAVPRNAAGETTPEQQNFQKAMIAQQTAQQNTQRAGFNVLLKNLNLSPQALFDTTKQTPGTVVPGRGFLPTADFMPDKPKGQMADPGQAPPDATHVAIGYRPPSTELIKSGKKKGQPVDPGDPGRVLSQDEFNALRDAQAQLAGPTANQAWQWMNTSPETTQTDFNGNPWTPDSIDEYNKLLPGVQKQFHKQIAEGFELPKQEVTTTTAPPQPPTAAFPVAPQPVTTVPDQQDQTVSDEAAAQNEGY